jgi:hypothetical protein
MNNLIPIEVLNEQLEELKRLRELTVQDADTISKQNSLIQQMQDLEIASSAEIFKLKEKIEGCALVLGQVMEGLKQSSQPQSEEAALNENGRLKAEQKASYSKEDMRNCFQAGRDYQHGEFSSIINDDKNNHPDFDTYINDLSMVAQSGQ